MAITEGLRTAVAKLQSNSFYGSVRRSAFLALPVVSVNPCIEIEMGKLNYKTEAEMTRERYAALYRRAKRIYELLEDSSYQESMSAARVLRIMQVCKIKSQESYFH